jgi:hypothetical protein
LTSGFSPKTNGFAFLPNRTKNVVQGTIFWFVVNVLLELFSFVIKDDSERVWPIKTRIKCAKMRKTRWPTLPRVIQQQKYLQCVCFCDVRPEASLEVIKFSQSKHDNKVVDV